MTLTDIALLNLRRRKAKAAFVLAGLLVGVATVVALVSAFRSVGHDVLHKMEKYGANILVVPDTKNLSLSYGGISLGGVSYETTPIRAEDVDRIRAIPSAENLAAVGPMVLGGITIGGKTVMLAGVDFKAASILKPWWSIRGVLPAPGQLLAGSEAAAVLGLGVGSLVPLGAEEAAVSGILDATGSQDDQILFTDIPTAQSVLGKPGEISMVEVAAHCMNCPIDALMTEISRVTPTAKVMAIKQVVEGRLSAVAHFEKVLYGVSLLVIAVGCLVVLVTMMGSVRERTTEIGVFRAIGFRRLHVMRIVMTEAAVVSLLAGILGYLAGVGATKLALPLFTGSPDASLYLSPGLAAGAVAMSVVLGLLSTLYPALVAANMDPNEALRTL